MADVVQYKLERMLNELDDLERRGLFSRREIAEIVKQRRKFEYRLKRPSPLKEDFLAYIEYEKKLDELRKLRKKSSFKDGKTKNRKKSVSDFAGVARIVEIYRLATTRFKGDIELWFQYLEFCRQRKNGRMKKALAEAVRFHPKVPGLWIYAAAWEFDTNLNAAAARALMQSGLRACPNSEDLWVEYLRMELTYMNKLKARKVVLGEDEGTLARSAQDVDEKKWRDENGDLFMALDEKSEENKAPNILDGESKEKTDFFQEQCLSIFQTVYSGAIEAFPSSFSLRARFLEILEATNLAHSGVIRNEILASLRNDFAKDPEFWDWLARYGSEYQESRHVMDNEISPYNLRKAIQVYDEGLEVAPSVALFNFYVKFLLDAIQKSGDSQASGDLINSENLNLISHVLEIYGRAESTECISEDLACGHVSFLLQLGRLDEAKKLIKKFCTETFPNAVQLWALRISLEMRCIEDESHSPGNDNLSSIFSLLTNAVSKVSTSKAEDLWVMAFKYFAHHRHYFDKLVETSIMLLTKYGGSDNGFSLSSMIVNHVLQRDGVQNAREMYKRFLALPHPGLSLYRNCIELELNIASTGCKDCLANARKLYESALTTYDQDVSLWQDYYLMEVKMGTSETAATVHWRARKTLKYNVTLSKTDL